MPRDGIRRWAWFGGATLGRLTREGKYVAAGPAPMSRVRSSSNFAKEHNLKLPHRRGPDSAIACSITLVRRLRWKPF